MEVLGRLWREVMGKERFWAPQGALLSVGEPVDLREHYERYRADKRGVVNELTQGLQAAMARMIEATQELQTPLPEMPG